MSDPTANYASDDVAQSFNPGSTPDQSQPQPEPQAPPVGSPDVSTGSIATDDQNQSNASGVANSVNASVAQDNASMGKPSMWRSILVGALTGALHGGIPGLVAGAIDPNRAIRADQQGQQLRRDQVQVADAQAQSAMQSTQFQKDSNPIQLGMLQTHLATLNAAYNTMPKTFQEKLQQEGAEAGQHLLDDGHEPVYHGSPEDADQHLRALMQTAADNPLSYIPLPDGNGGVNIFQVPNADKAYEHPVTITIGHEQDGTPITKTYQPGQISIARSLNLESAAMLDESQRQGKLALQASKNQGAANVAQIRARAQSGTASVNELAPQLLNGNLSPSMLSTRNNYRANAVAAADALSRSQGGPGYSGVTAQNTADATKAVQKDFTSGKAAQTITAFNTASGHLDHLDSLVGALDNGNVQLFNQLGNNVAKELGIAAPANFDAVKSAVAGEVSKTFTGNVATDSEIGHVGDILKSAQSPAQLHGAIGQIRSLLDSKKQALQGQYKQGMSGEPNFNPALLKVVKSSIRRQGKLR